MTWTDKAFVNVSFGGQVGSHTLASSTSFSLYDEDGTLGSSQKIGGGGVFDISAGYKVHKNLAAGVGYSWSSDKADASITALVPDPVVTDHPRGVTASVPGLKHTENTIHLFAAWMVPVTDKIDVAFIGGPSIFMVSQDLPASMTVTEPGPTVNQITTEKSSKTGVGFNIGLDVAYMLNKRFGVGGLARYTWGSVDLPQATESLTAGGFQIGVGLRMRVQ